MRLKNFFKFRKWEPDLSRKPPARSEWPDHIIALNGKKFDEFIRKYPLSIIDFWAPWCGPCKTIAPRIRQLSKEYKGQVAFGKVNIDNHKDIAKRFHVSGIPNLSFFSYGEKITNLTGVKPISDIQYEIEEILAKFQNDK